MRYIHATSDGAVCHAVHQTMRRAAQGQKAARTAKEREPRIVRKQMAASRARALACRQAYALKHA